MLVFWWLGAAAMLHAQQPNVHYWHHGIMPPGAIGSQQLQRGGPLPGFFQPVEIRVPAGAKVSLTIDSQFDEPAANSRKAGMLIGAVYRMRVTGIRFAEGAEVFPTVEVIDRLYAPVGQELRFPIPIDITEADMKLALAGKFVTRVIYLEDPRHALPAREVGKSQNWFEAAPGQDPLAVADGLGRPVAILRLGGRLPDQGSDPFFFFGSPPFIPCPTEQAPAATRSAVAERSDAAVQLPTRRAAAIATMSAELPQNRDRIAAQQARQPAADPVGVIVERPVEAVVERPPESIPAPSRHKATARPSVNNLPPPPDSPPAGQPGSARSQPTINEGLAREGLRQS
jgi:hypothetical protein